MLTITSYVHRQELCEVIRRWLSGELWTQDAELVGRLINFNNVYVSRYMRRLAGELFQALHGPGLYARHVRVKRELKDVLVERPHYLGPRIEELIQDYRAQPERFYGETPFHGTLYFLGSGAAARYTGSSRIKRIRRLAEKAARLIIDAFFQAIQADARAMAERRARLLGVAPQQLLTPPAQMEEEFLQAESHIIAEIRQGYPLLGREGVTINDVAGIKVILEDAEQERLQEVLQRHGRCEIIEEERYEGNYRATNLLIRYRPPREELLAEPLSEEVLAVLKRRGMMAPQANAAFAEFVLTAEEAVRLEIIVSSYQDTLESEVGRCMHEDRIIAQRHRQPYRSFLAKNIEYLMEYLFTLPASSVLKLPELPIKLWNRYLADYFDSVLKELFHIPTVDILD